MLYVGEEYNLKFQSDKIPNEQIQVGVIENNDTIISPLNGRAVFNYTPHSQGKVTFVRYLNGRPYDVYPLRPINSLPRPTFVGQPVKNGDGYLIRTRSYGRVNGKENRSELK